MSDKISQALWKAFVQSETKNIQPKLGLDDKDVLKALAKFDKTDEREPEPRLEALKELANEVPKQITALVKLKKQLGDKVFGKLKDKLYEILEEAEALQKKTQAALDAEDDEDEDSVPSALVNPKLLLKQLTLCRKDPERTMKFALVDAKGKDQPAMLAMHPRMGARALFGKLQAAAGVKTGAYGTAWVDGTNLMLQLDKPLSGLVKKVRPPVKACGFRITKAVLWNADGTVFEQDEVPEEAVGEGPAQAAPGGPAETGKGRSTAPPTSGSEGDSVAFKARLTALIQKIKEAQIAGHAGAQDAKLKASEAGIFAGKRDFDRANALLDKAKAALQAGGEPGAGDDPSNALKAASRAGPTRNTAESTDFPRHWAAAVERWRAASDSVDGQVSKLQAALKQSDDDELHDIAETGLNGITAGAKVGLLAAIRELGAATDVVSAGRIGKARKAVAQFRAQIERDPRVGACDDNPFGVQVSLRATLLPALDGLEDALASAPTTSTTS